MRYGLIALCMLMGSLTPAVAQLSITFQSPGVSIGINVPVYPQLQPIPGYPVYYAPGMSSNYFFYDGLYWVYNGDYWYASSWYNGPWHLVEPVYVPYFILRVPVRYYRHPPVYFHGWRADDPPRWGEHWGHSWEERRSGWDRWDRHSAPPPAPLPHYQREYSGNRYPQPSQQAVIQTRQYRYQPKDPVAQEHFKQQKERAPSERSQQVAPQPQQTAPRERAPRQQRPQQVERQPQQTPVPQTQQEPRSQAQEKARRDKGQDRGQGREKDDKEKDNEEKGRER